MASNVLIVGGGSKLGLELSKQYSKQKDTQVDIITSTPLLDMEHHLVNWKNLTPETIQQAAQSFDSKVYDIIIFNQNMYMPHKLCYYVDAEEPIEGTVKLLQHCHLVNNLLPGILLNGIKTKLNQDTKVVWFLSGMVHGWRHKSSPVGFAAYANTKAQNYYNMTGFNSISPDKGIFVAINPGHFGIDSGGDTYEKAAYDVIRGIAVIEQSHSGKFVCISPTEAPEGYIGTWKTELYDYDFINERY